MADFMEIPDTWEQFLEMYSFKDVEEHYTNGALIITVSRVKQMREFYFSDVAPVVHGRWEEKPIEYTYFDTKMRSISYVCSVCGDNRRFGLGAGNYCPNCGAKMGLE